MLLKASYQKGKVSEASERPGMSMSELSLIAILLGCIMVVIEFHICIIALIVFLLLVFAFISSGVKGE